MPPGKVKPTFKSSDASCYSSISRNASREGSSENASNRNRGLLKLPFELWGEIFGYYRTIDLQLEATLHSNHSGDPVLPIFYLEKSDALRSLSQVCVAYRRNFLSFLWHDLMACVGPRPSNPKPRLFFRHVAEALVSKCQGLTSNPELAGMVRCAKLALTRYQSATSMPILATTLASLPNLHTLHILHAHTRLTTAFKNGFEGVSLPQIRTVVIPGFCHEILKTCSNVKTVWCTEEDGHKLISTIQTYSLPVEELRGIKLGTGKFKKVVKAAPKLEVIEIEPWQVDEILSHLPQFKKFRRLIIKVSGVVYADENKRIQLEQSISDITKKSVAVLKKLRSKDSAKKISFSLLYVKPAARGYYEPPDIRCEEVDLA